MVRTVSFSTLFSCVATSCSSSLHSSSRDWFRITQKAASTSTFFMRPPSASSDTSQEKSSPRCVCWSEKGGNGKLSFIIYSSDCSDAPTFTNAAQEKVPSPSSMESTAATMSRNDVQAMPSRYCSVFTWPFRSEQP